MPNIDGTSGSDTLVGGVAADTFSGLDGNDFFTIGQGDKVGPDLAGVTTRRSRAWLTSYITQPERLCVEQDPVVRALVARIPTVRTPSLDLSEHDAADVMLLSRRKPTALKPTSRARRRTAATAIITTITSGAICGRAAGVINHISSFVTE